MTHINIYTNSIFFSSNNFSTEKCYDTIIQTTKTLQYKSDGLTGLITDNLSYSRHSVSDNNSEFLILNNLVIEALLLERQGRDGVSTYTMFSVKTNEPYPTLNMYPLPMKLRNFHSICPSYRSYCGQCNYIKKFENDVRNYLNYTCLYFYVN